MSASSDSLGSERRGVPVQSDGESHTCNYLPLGRAQALVLGAFMGEHFSVQLPPSGPRSGRRMTGMRRGSRSDPMERGETIPGELGSISGELRFSAVNPGEIGHGSSPTRRDLGLGFGSGSLR